jgi:zinc and cadmium transporter
MAFIETIISVVIVSLISFIGLFSLSIKIETLKKYLLFFIGLSTGTLFATAFLHLLPETFEKIGFGVDVSLLILLGVVIFYLLEKFVHMHHEHLPGKTTKSYLAPMNLVADGIHNFLDGIIIAVSYLVDTTLGITTTIAVIMHEIPQEIADFGVLIYAGYTRKKALFFNFLSATFSILGALIAFYIGVNSENFVAYIIPIAAGGFIYIAGSNLIPELQKEKEFKKSIMHFLAIIMGMLIIYIL